MTSKSVNIVLSDVGWILERLAKEISDRLPYVGYSLNADSSVPIQYYITYGCRKERVSDIEIGLFTHREDDASAAARFDRIAGEVDYAIAMSGATDALLSNLGIERHSVISPGVDLERFCPKLKIAVVGRTYHTGRKGEGLVRSVLDVPHIEWHFTGSGWPEPALHIADANLPAFYRSMDYILVPALIEGGPMSVIEALASGVQVIGPPVGWVPDFPHISFELGNADSLRGVLENLVAERLALRDSVKDMTWDNWAKQHDELFRSLLSSYAGMGVKSSSPMPRKARSAALITHGIEDKTLGGPSVRVPGTVRSLKALNVNAHSVYNSSPIMSKMDIVHSFNVWLPRTALTVARKVKALHKPFVFSPIMLDLSEGPLWRADVLRAFRPAQSPAEAADAMRFYRRRQIERSSLMPVVEPEPGYKDMLKEIADLSDGLIYLSEKEQAAFTALTGTTTPGFLVHNPVDADMFRDGDPDLFRHTYGLDDYVLCLGRIELRKNQLMLAAALVGTGIKLVLVGHSAGDEYLQLIKRFGGDNLLHVDRLEPGSEMLRSAIVGARVFVLPSWSEGAPLAALEAGAAGANLVLSDRSGEREYFGTMARYCDPADMDSIRTEVLEAWNSPLKKKQIRQLREHIAKNYSWERYAKDTLQVYETVLDLKDETVKSLDVGADEKPLNPDAELVLDITTWANFGATLSGIVRVERSLALEFIKRTDIRVRFIFYHSTAVGFLEIPFEVVRDNVLIAFVARLRSSAPTKNDNHFAHGSQLVAVGSSWMQNAEYALELRQFARQAGLTLSVLMHDLTPALFPHWYLPGYSARWAANCANVIASADRLLVYSHSTTSDVLAFAQKHGVDAPPISKVRLADEIGMLTTQPTKEGEAVQRMLKGKPFVLSVGAIHIRKNYTLLYDVWTILSKSMGGGCPHLVIVGGVGWNGAEIARVMREDPRVSSLIHIVENIDDMTLEWLYSHALMTAYPSLYEGWGLPVGESLAHGKICLSSNSSSMPEIAPEFTDLLDPFDRAAWAARIQHYASSRSSRTQQEARIKDQFAITQWSTTAAQIIETLNHDAREKDDAGAYSLGDIVLACEAQGVGPYLRSGWYRPENWGCWGRSTNSAINLTLVHEPEEDLVLTVVAKVLKLAHDEHQYRVKANGVYLGTWVFSAKNPKSNNGFEPLLNRVVVPLDVLRLAESLTIEFEADRLCAVKDINPKSQDTRSMGFGLIAFLLEERSQSGDVAEILNGRGNIRTLLATGRNFDLPSLIAHSGYRPSIIPDKWIRSFEPFLKKGKQVDTLGAQAEAGLFELTIGLGRLHFNKDAELQFIVVVPSATSEQSANISIFLNGSWLGTKQIDSAEPKFCSIIVPGSRLFASDPASFSFFTSGSKSGTEPDFRLAQMNLRQNVALPSDSHALLVAGKTLDIVAQNRAVGQLDTALASGWYGVEPQGAWSIGSTGRIAVTLDLSDAVQVYLIARFSRISSGQDGDTVELVCEEQDITGQLAFPCQAPATPQGTQSMFIDVTKLAGKVSQLSAKVVVNNLDRIPRDASKDPRSLGARILAIGAVKALPFRSNDVLNIVRAGDGRVIWFDGWNAPEASGRWACNDEASIGLYIDRSLLAATIVLGLSWLVNPNLDNQNQQLHIYCDNVEVAILEATRTARASVEIPVEHMIGGSGYHHIRVAGIGPVSPEQAGLGEDTRQLSICLHQVAVDPVLISTEK